MVDTSGRSTWSALLRPPHAKVIAVLAGGTALHAMNVYLVTAMLPSVVEDIGGLALYAWNTTLFMLASVISSALVPKIVRQFGTRRAYQVALGTFTGGTVGCAAAPDMAVLLAGRTVQGLGGGLLIGLSYAMIGAMLPQRLWTRAAGVLSAMWGAGTLVGPALGGGAAQAGEWRTAFLALVPFAVVVLLAARSAVPGPHRGGRTQPSTVHMTIGEAGTPVTSLVLVAAAVLVVSATSLAPQAFLNLGGVALGILILGLVVHRERTRTPGLLPAGALAPGSGLRPVFAALAMLVFASTVEIFVPFYGRILGGVEPLAAGFLGAAIAAGWTAGSMISASRPATIIRAAPLITGLALAALAVFSRPAASLPMVLAWALLLFAAGSGVGIAWPHAVAAVMAFGRSQEERDAASASVTTVQLVVTSLGAAVAGSVTNLAGAAGHTAAIWLYGVFALIALTAAVPAIRMSAKGAFCGSPAVFVGNGE